MVRLIGAVLILFGTVGIGYDRMRQIKRHYEGLLDWRECMLKIQGDMQSLKKPLPDIIAELGHHAPEVFQPFFMQVHKELMQYENSSPKSCWKEAWKVWENREIFTKEEGQLFLESGRLLEQGSGGMFEKEAELLIERINILIQREQTEMQREDKSQHVPVCYRRNISGAVLVYGGEDERKPDI